MNYRIGICDDVLLMKNGSLSEYGQAETFLKVSEGKVYEVKSEEQKEDDIVIKQYLGPHGLPYSRVIRENEKTLPCVTSTFEDSYVYAIHKEQ